MRLAFLGDIHGNLPALEAALADLDSHAPDAVYLTGDLVNRCPWNNEVMALLDERGWPSIFGNHEQVLLRIAQIVDEQGAESAEAVAGQRKFPGIYWTYQRLQPAYLDVLRAFPAQRRIEIDGGPAIRLFHGIPGNAFVGLTPEMADEELATALAEIDEPTVVCAHIHRPLARQIDGWQIFNASSVGMPYSGDPRAQYLLLDLVDGVSGPRWQPTFRHVEYDRCGVEAAFRLSGMLSAVGPMADLYLRTVLTGEPWASDFGHWLKSQPLPVREDWEDAVRLYLAQHGPGRWAFG